MYLSSEILANLVNKNAIKLSNGHSQANLANSSTHQNGHFWKYARLARLADIRQTVYQGLVRLAKQFTEYSPDLRKVSLASVMRIWQIWRVWQM